MMRRRSRQDYEDEEALRADVKFLRQLKDGVAQMGPTCEFIKSPPIDVIAPPSDSLERIEYDRRFAADWLVELAERAHAMLERLRTENAELRNECAAYYMDELSILHKYLGTSETMKVMAARDDDDG